MSSVQDGPVEAGLGLRSPTRSGIAARAVLYQQCARRREPGQRRGVLRPGAPGEQDAQRGMRWSGPQVCARSAVCAGAAPVATPCVPRCVRQRKRKRVGVIANARRASSAMRAPRRAGAMGEVLRPAAPGEQDVRGAACVKPPRSPLPVALVRGTQSTEDPRAGLAAAAPSPARRRIPTLTRKE
jgi:hypothetical protein